jgi:hypothetical protein
MSESRQRLKVECYAGYRSEEEPRRFTLGGHAVEIVEILDRWLSPDHRYFKVKGDDRSMYLLRHDVHTMSWQIIQRSSLL